MKSFSIHTLGCKTNQLESSIIYDELVKAGWKAEPFNGHADIYIINTCTVTSKTDSESKYLVRKAKRTNPKAKIIVIGCFAQVSPEELSSIDDIDLVIGNKDKLNLVEILNNSGISDTKNVIVSDIMKEKEFLDRQVFSASGRTRVNIKIQDGCNNRCTYCIIPYARGKSRSSKMENVIAQIKNIADQGYKEIILSGIHLGQWGLDLRPKQKFLDLLKEIDKIGNLPRYRISSLDPQEIDDEIIEFLTASKKFCRHLHIAMQSPDNKVLRAMRRGYDVEFFEKTINKLVKNMPDIALGSDIIVGFPGETDEMFEDGFRAIERFPLSYLHIFPYSRRKGTLAADMLDQIQEGVKKERANRLKALSDKKNRLFKENFIGKELNVLAERQRDRKTGLLKGLSRNYISVLFEGDDNIKNTIVKVRLTELYGNNASGVLT